MSATSRGERPGPLRADCLGLDIGGANLKAATADGFAVEVPFPLWSRPDHLASELAELITNAPSADALAVTMTGELADCYPNRAEGVASIAAAVEEAAAGTAAWYYSLDGRFLPADRASRCWRRVAAANWRALAAAAVDGDGVLIDIGSTTTDIVVVRDHSIDGGGETDTERLVSGGLLYQGVGRTPICAVVSKLPYRGRECPVAAELFATTGDAALVLGRMPADASVETPDGRPFTAPHAVARVGRMVCADASDFEHGDAVAASRRVFDVMSKRLGSRWLRRVRQSGVEPPQVVLSGSGAWLARETLARLGVLEVALLSDRIGVDASRCGPAWAVATLFEEQRPG